MSWPERMAAEAVKQSKAADIALSPRSPIPAYAPSEWLEQSVRQNSAALLQAVAGIQQGLQPRAQLTGPDGRALGPPFDPMLAVLQSLQRVMTALAMQNDLLLTYLTGKPDLRPVGAPPENGDGKA